MFRLLHSVSILILFLTLPGCNKLRKSWTKVDYKGQYFSTLAVVGLSTKFNERNDYETFSVGLLTENEINAVHGTAVFPISENSGSSIESKILENKLDGILTIGLVESEQVGVLPKEYQEFSKFYAHRFTELNMQNYLVAGKKYAMEALLYDLTLQEEENLVWRGEMAVLDPESIEAKKRFMRRMVHHLIDEELIHIAPDQAPLEAGVFKITYP